MSFRTRLAAVAVAVAATTGLAGAASAQAAVRSFESPSGNIACVYDSDTLGVPAITCDMHSSGVNYTMDSRRRVRMTDSIGLSGGRILGYGQTFKMGRLSCTMRQAGLTCASSYSGHGFFMSRTEYYRF